MKTLKRVSQVFKTAEEIPFDDSSSIYLGSKSKVLGGH